MKQCQILVVPFSGVGKFPCGMRVEALGLCKRHYNEHWRGDKKYVNESRDLYDGPDPLESGRELKPLFKDK